MPSQFYSPYFEVQGAAEIQWAMKKVFKAVNPRGGLGKAVRNVTDFYHNKVLLYTHQVTGLLRASHVEEFFDDGPKDFLGRIYIKRGRRNRLTGKFADVYGPKEHARGGTHMFYETPFFKNRGMAKRIADETLRGELP